MQYRYYVQTVDTITVNQLHSVNNYRQASINGIKSLSEL